MSDNENNNDGILGLPIPPGVLEGLFGVKSQDAKDKEEMGKAANELRMRTFIESLSDDQLDTLKWLTNTFAGEGQHNYLTCTFYGMLCADVWRRQPITPEGAEVSS